MPKFTHNLESVKRLTSNDNVNLNFNHYLLWLSNFNLYVYVHCLSMFYIRHVFKLNINANYTY